jgi:hypothetical protein
MKKRGWRGNSNKYPNMLRQHSQIKANINQSIIKRKGHGMQKMINPPLRMKT